MKSEKEIRKQAEFIENIITNEELLDDVFIPRGKLLRLRRRLEVLKWILDEEEKKDDN